MPKKPIPIWMKTIAAAAAILIFAGIWILPPAVQAALEGRKGLEAQQDGRHSTAIKEYEQAMQSSPNSAEIAARLAVSYFQNEKMDKCSEMLIRLQGKRLPGKLARQVNDIVGKLDSSYHESSELTEVLRLYGQEELEKTASRLEAYLKNNETDVMGNFHLANIYLDIGNIKKAEELYNQVLKLEPEFYSAKLNLAALYRLKGDYESSEEWCMRVLNANKEHPQAFVSLSKLELARGDNNRGLEYAKKAYEYDGEDLQIAANLCIAYDHNGMAAERDKLFQTLQQKDFYDLTALQSELIDRK